jgi:hypothetical protein
MSNMNNRTNSGTSTKARTTFRVTKAFVAAAVCGLVVLGLIAREASLRTARLDAHRPLVVDYARPEDATLEGRIAMSKFVGEVEIVGVDRRYMAEGYDEATRSMRVAPGSLGLNHDPVPGDVSHGDVSPITEFQARVIETYAGDLKPGQTFVVRTYGHAALTKDEAAKNLARGILMESPGDRLIVTVGLAGDGRYVYNDGKRIVARVDNGALEYLVAPGAPRDVIDNMGGLLNRDGVKALTRWHFGRPAQRRP